MGCRFFRPFQNRKITAKTHQRPRERARWGNVNNAGLVPKIAFTNMTGLFQRRGQIFHFRDGHLGFARQRPKMTHGCLRFGKEAHFSVPLPAISLLPQGAALHSQTGDRSFLTVVYFKHRGACTTSEWFVGGKKGNGILRSTLPGTSQIISHGLFRTKRPFS